MWLLRGSSVWFALLPRLPVLRLSGARISAEPDKTLKKDVENTVAAGVYGTAAGIEAAALIEKAAENALQAAF